MTIRTQIWNSGGGVQSTAIAALIVLGKLPKPDLAVIADTGRERSTTWRYLEKWVMPALQTAGVTLHRVKKEDYTSIDLYGGKDKDTLLIPAFTTQSGDVGKLPTYCSAEWKRDVIRRWASKTHNVKQATNWIGYSIDEVGRAATAQKSRKNQGKWQVTFPLIDSSLNRGDCVAIVERMGWPTPPRSSCWMCPNHLMQEWREIRNDPRDWKGVIEFENKLRLADRHIWLTDQAVPIEQADFNDSQEVLFGRDDGGCDSGFCFV